MAKVRPSNLFLWPLDLFCYLAKQTIKVNYDKFEQNFTYFFSKSIKWTDFFSASQTSELILKGAAPDEE